LRFTLAGRFLLGWLEPPEVKMLRMRKRRRHEAVQSDEGGDQRVGRRGKGAAVRVHHFQKRVMAEETA
jgi:hypothetical protein